MNLKDIYAEIPEASKSVDASAILIVICSEGSPIIYRTMEEDNYQYLLELLKKVKPTATMQ